MLLAIKLSSMGIDRGGVVYRRPISYLDCTKRAKDVENTVREVQLGGIAVDEHQKGGRDGNHV